METSGILLESLMLENGLHVFFYNRSKPIAGDRCLVQLLIDIPIPLSPSQFEHLPDSKATSEAFMAHCGFTLHYQTVKTRHFVPKQEEGTTLSQLRREITEAVFHYLQHPKFAQNYVLKTFDEWLKKEYCLLAHSEAIKSAESKDG